MNEEIVIDLTEAYTNCAICNECTPLKWSIPMYKGKKVDITKTGVWAGMPVCKECYYDALVRGRTFAVKGNIRKAVVISRKNEMVTWSFLNNHKKLGLDSVRDISAHSDGIYDIQMDFLAEVEAMKSDAPTLQEE
ncbi:MAG: hypothetical protein PHW62_00195 [Candidatus Ratteibacteria bacterium]|nr:hypothetical protein [Candidatus Ratteibacteria bacterium]